MSIALSAGSAKKQVCEKIYVCVCVYMCYTHTHKHMYIYTQWSLFLMSMIPFLYHEKSTGLEVVDQGLETPVLRIHSLAIKPWANLLSSTSASLILKIRK